MIVITDDEARTVLIALSASSVIAEQRGQTVNVSLFDDLAAKISAELDWIAMNKR